jgi:hypothetical protein
VIVAASPALARVSACVTSCRCRRDVGSVAGTALASFITLSWVSRHAQGIGAALIGLLADEDLTLQRLDALS